MPTTTASSWYLEGLVGDPPSLRQVAITAWPFRIGRGSDVAFSLPSGGVSKEHAELRLENGLLLVRDLESRNGTFVNGKRIDDETPVKDGDVLHFANQEF